MANLLNLKEHLKYCGCGIGNSGSCANLATFKVSLERRTIKKLENKNSKTDYRCEKHKISGSTSFKVVVSEPFEQKEKHQLVNEFLTSLIGKNIHSRFHTAIQLRVKYLKENGGVMCFQEHSKKWKYVYYNQIDEILS